MLFKFDNLPSSVFLKGCFSDSCSLFLSDESLLSLKNGSLSLRLQKRGAETSMVSGLKISIFSSKGQIIINVGSDDSEIIFGRASSGFFKLHLWRKSRVVIGDGTTSVETKIVCDKSEFITGKDCMFSDRVLIQSADQHGIVDLKSGKIINKKKRKIILGDHVWLGRACTLMPDVEIGEGSVIATNATVTRNAPEFSISAGTPARVVKSNMSWSRSVDKKDEFSEYYVQEYKSLQEKK